MRRFTSNDPNNPHTDSKGIELALSTLEQQMFQAILEKKAAEKAQAEHANDADKLSYLFGIFH